MSTIVYMELPQDIFSCYLKEDDSLVINSMHKDSCFFEDLPEGILNITDTRKPAIHLINAKYFPGQEAGGCHE